MGHLWRALYPLALHLVGGGGAVQASSLISHGRRTIVMLDPMAR
jgi:hypothetical protein